jgi:hypothetical protein
VGAANDRPERWDLAQAVIRTIRHHYSNRNHWPAAEICSSHTVVPRREKVHKERSCNEGDYCLDGNDYLTAANAVPSDLVSEERMILHYKNRSHPY